MRHGANLPAIALGIAAGALASMTGGYAIASYATAGVSDAFVAAPRAEPPRVVSTPGAFDELTTVERIAASTDLARAGADPFDDSGLQGQASGSSRL